MSKSEVKTTLSNHLNGQTATDQELTSEAQAVLALFELLIQADKEARNENKQHPDHSDTA